MTELFLAQQAALAEAAVEFVRARRANVLNRSPETGWHFEQANEKMCWLVDAIEHGWHPDDFVSELPEV